MAASSSIPRAVLEQLRRFDTPTVCNVVELFDLRSRSGGYLDARIQAPIIVTFHAPADPKYAFKPFYDEVRNRGFILYPGKLTQLETFRVGGIGAIGPEEMRHAVNAVRDSLRTLGLSMGIAATNKQPVAATARAV